MPKIDFTFTQIFNKNNNKKYFSPLWWYYVDQCPDETLRCVITSVKETIPVI